MLITGANCNFVALYLARIVAIYILVFFILGFSPVVYSKAKCNSSFFATLVFNLHTILSARQPTCHPVNYQTGPSVQTVQRAFIPFGR